MVRHSSQMAAAEVGLRGVEAELMSLEEVGEQQDLVEVEVAMAANQELEPFSFNDESKNFEEL